MINREFNERIYFYQTVYPWNSLIYSGRQTIYTFDRNVGIIYEKTNKMFSSSQKLVDDTSFLIKLILIFKKILYFSKQLYVFLVYTTFH